VFLIKGAYAPLIKCIFPLQSRTSKVFNNIFFIIYILYYIDQISNLEIHVEPINEEGDIKCEFRRFFIIISEKLKAM
jgi:hypothetical protein